MDPRELELIALTQLLTRYRVGVANDDRLDLPEVKSEISQAAKNTSGDDSDNIEINIGSLTTESNVTIVEQTVESDEKPHDDHHDHHHVNEPTPEEAPVEQVSPESDTGNTQKPTLGSRLMKLFKDDKNDTV